MTQEKSGMAETGVENKICEACGADVRPGSLFCYNCGSAVAPNSAIETEKKNLYETGKLGLNGNIDKDKNNSFEKPIEKPFGSPLETVAEVKDKKLSFQEQNKIKASAERHRQRIAEKKTVEVVWEKPEGSTGKWFILASLILILFAVCVLWAALYIR